MKTKTILISLMMLILACSITAIAAENVEIAGYTFEIPDGYTELNSTDDQIVLTQDDQHAIVIMFSKEIANSDDARKNLESKGYKFLGEESYDAVDYEVNQQNYEKDGLTVYSYNFEMEDGEYCIITFTIPSDETAPENEDNPVTGILESIQ